MSKKIISIPTISKVDFLHTTDESFGTPKTLAIMSCYLEGDQFQSFKISNVDFATGIIESQDGMLYHTTDIDKLASLSSIFKMDLPETVPEITEMANQPSVEDIIVEKSSMIIDDKKYAILAMYHDVDSDQEKDIIKSKISEKEGELDTLAQSPEANAAKMSALTEDVNNAAAYLAENKDVSMDMFVSANATFILQDKTTGEITSLRLENLTYSDVANMVGFEVPETKTPDKELVSKLDEMSSQISKANTSHIHHFNENDTAMPEIKNFDVDGGKITGFIGDKKVTLPIERVEVMHSKYGLTLVVAPEQTSNPLTEEPKEYIVTGVAKDCPYRSTVTLYNAICDAKEQESILDMTTKDAEESKVMQQVASMNVSTQCVWEPGSKEPQKQYTVAGQVMDEEKLKTHIYASETTGFMAMRIGDDTKIIMTDDSFLAKSTKEITEVLSVDGGFHIKDAKGHTVAVDYLDTGSSMLIANGVVYKCSDSLTIETIGEKFSTLTPYNTGKIDIVQDPTAESSGPDVSNMNKSNRIITEILKTQNGYEITSDNGEKVKIDYLDTKAGMLIAGDTYYQCNEFLQVKHSDIPITYINSATNEIDAVIDRHSETAATLVNNWDIVTDGHKLFLTRNIESKESGEIIADPSMMKEIKSITLDDETGLLRVKFDRGYAYLGEPATNATEMSAFTTQENDVTRRLSMAETIEMSKEGINTVINKVNENVNEKPGKNITIKNPKEIVREVPDSAFVVMNNKLYYKAPAFDENGNIKVDSNGNTQYFLHSKDETLSFDKCREDIKFAGMLSRDTEIEMLTRMSSETIYVLTKDFKDVRSLDIISEKEVRETFGLREDAKIDERLVSSRYIPDSEIESLNILDSKEASFSREIDDDVVQGIEIE